VATLIEGVVPLPPVLGLRRKGALERLYTHDHLSAREISHLAGASRSDVLNALNRFNLPRSTAKPTRIGPLPFGFEYINHQLVKNNAERAAIRKMQEYRARRLSLRAIAGALNLKPIPTKHNGVWHANTVRGILARA
jgi:hypothetical protein